MKTTQFTHHLDLTASENTGSEVRCNSLDHCMHADLNTGLFTDDDLNTGLFTDDDLNTGLFTDDDLNTGLFTGLGRPCIPCGNGLCVCRRVYAYSVQINEPLSEGVRIQGVLRY